MATRRFQLPGIQDLSKEQERVRALPLEGQHLIIGGPGTGKSVMALLRANVLANDALNYRFLVFNHLLKQSSQKLFGQPLRSEQWQSWFISIFENHLNQRIPRHATGDRATYKPFDWDEINRLCNTYEGYDDTDGPLFLIIDEGQDMPSAFYEALANLFFENIFVVADQNQQIVNEQNSSRRDLEDALDLNPSNTIELTDNYRNRLPVARLAIEFYPGDPASRPPKLPPAPRDELKKPLLFHYRQEQFTRIIHRILTMATNRPTKLIGILCPNNRVREKYYNALWVNNKTSNTSPLLISTFKSGDKTVMPFDEGGIMVINAQACKGLEFDVVFIADIDQFSFSHQNRESAQKLFYVMVARAIEHVILLRQQGEAKPIDDIIPTDHPSVLEIK